MYTFYVTIHALPDAAKPGATIVLGRKGVRNQFANLTSEEAIGTERELVPDTFSTLDIPPAALSIPFGISFEEAAERLSQLPRSCVEPDGSFFYGSAQGEPPWQVDGNLFDRNGRLLFVDLKGDCPPEEFDRLLAAIGWPDTRLAFQLVREAVLLEEAEFRRWASG
jgi:hypothetical protein